MWKYITDSSTDNANEGTKKLKNSNEDKQKETIDEVVVVEPSTSDHDRWRNSH